MAMHSFLRNFRRDGILPAKKQEHINSPDKIWPRGILRPILHTKLPVCGDREQQRRCRKKPDNGFFSLAHRIPPAKDDSNRSIQLDNDKNIIA